MYADRFKKSTICKHKNNIFLPYLCYLNFSPPSPLSLSMASLKEISLSIVSSDMERDTKGKEESAFIDAVTKGHGLGLDPWPSCL